MGGGGKSNAFVDLALAQAEEKKRREATVPIEDKKRLQAAGTAKRRAKRKGRNSTLLSKSGEGDTLGVK